MLRRLRQGHSFDPYEEQGHSLFNGKPLQMGGEHAQFGPGIGWEVITGKRGQIRAGVVDQADATPDLEVTNTTSAFFDADPPEPVAKAIRLAQPVEPHTDRKKAASDLQSINTALESRVQQRT
ncbi:MAG: hypothetical protein AAF658_20385, partial [Myxococcota bacterium]